MAIQKTNINDILDKNYAEFDLGLLCEDKYKDLKHIDMVIYTLLHNQHGLSVKTTMTGNKRFVDSNGNIFISISQEKLCKILRTTKPTLNASLNRLEEMELLEVVRVGKTKCNRIYVGKLERTTTLGDYIKSLNLSDEEEYKDKEISIKTVNIKDIKENKKASTCDEVEASEELENKSSDSTNKNSNNSIPQSDKSNNKKEFKPNYSLNPKIHKNLSTKFLNYGNDEDLERMLLESQKSKFNEN